jgi:hypothetical protein
MKANEDKQLEKFAGKLMNETSLEKPSAEFTSKVMFGVLAAGTGIATAYKPLISKPLWFIIFGAVIMVMGYLIINADAQPGGWLDSLDMNAVNDKILKSLAGFKFSEITLFTVGLSTVMLFVQITFLKSYFNKRFKA